MHSPGLFIAARVLVGCMFLYSGSSQLLGFRGTVAMMESYQFPVARVALAAAIAWEFVWGALMIAGLFLFADGLALAFFVLLATCMIHAKDAGKPERRPMALVHIGNNMTVIGGLLAIAAH